MNALALLLPTIVAMLATALDRGHAMAKYFALSGALLSLALLPLVDSGTSSFIWLIIGSTPITITTSVTPLNYLLLALVLVIAPLIFLYSFGFITLPSEQKRYYIEMLAFETAMLAFAMSGDFVLLFIAWEFLSLTSYLLIGFWYSRERAIAAARKTITIILLGDLALLGAIVIMQGYFGTLVFDNIISAVAGFGFPPVAAALLLVAVATKSAQFPFQEWLPDAMEGPTPVSAFLHSTTMVKAGVFVAIVLFPLFSVTNLLPKLLAISAITVALSILNALREKHVKRVLAYSTLQELGLMLAALSLGAPIPAVVYFFFAQSFYKALLFFSAGVTMKANDEEMIDRIAGLGSNKLVYLTTIFGILALAGFLPFDGFFANVFIGSSLVSNILWYALLSAAGFGTSLYIFRWFFLQDKRNVKARVKFAYESVPASMSFSMVALAAATLLASLFFFSIPGFLAGSQCAGGCGSPTVDNFDAIVETLVAAMGAIAAYILFKQNGAPSKSTTKTKIADLAYTATLMNSLYAHFAAFVEVLAAGIEYLDAGLNTVFDGFGRAMIRTSQISRLLAAGNANTYVVIFAAGVLLLILAVVVV